MSLRRREFIAGIGGAAGWPLAARAQQGDRVRRIGVLSAQAMDSPRRFGWTRSDKDSPDLAGSKAATCKSMCVIPRGGSGALRPSPRSWWRCGLT